MSRIVISVPIGMEKEVYNTLQYLIKNTDYELFSLDLIAKELKMLPHLKDKSNAELLLLAAMTEETQNFFGSENIIYIGLTTIESKYNNFIVYYPDIVSAQEELLETKYNYYQYFLSSTKAEFSTNDMPELLKYVSKLIGKEWTN